MDLIKYILDYRKYSELTEAQRLKVLRDHTNLARLNHARLHAGMNVNVMYMTAQQLLAVGAVFYRDASARGGPNVLYCPEFNQPVDERYRREFTVAAGKLDGDETNWKYIESFIDMSSALKALASCRGYPIVELTYVDADGKRWDLTVEERV